MSTSSTSSSSSSSSSGSSSSSSSSSSAPKPWISETLLTRLQAFQNADYSDVILDFGKGETTRAHRLLLSLHSNVLNARISEAEKKKKSGETTTISLSDISAPEATLMIGYIYGNAILESSNAGILLGVANILDMPQLKADVFALMGTGFTFASIPGLFSVAYGSGKPNEEAVSMINSKVLPWLGPKMKSFVDSPDWLRMTVPGMIALLKSDELRISEIALFEALFKWARPQLKETKESKTESKDEPVKDSEPSWEVLVRPLLPILEPLLPYVRFPLISSADFTTKVVPLGFLSTEDQLGLFAAIGSGSKEGYGKWSGVKRAAVVTYFKTDMKTISDGGTETPGSYVWKFDDANSFTGKSRFSGWTPTPINGRWEGGVISWTEDYKATGGSRNGLYRLEDSSLLGTTTTLLDCFEKATSNEPNISWQGRYTADDGGWNGRWFLSNVTAIDESVALGLL